MLDPHAGHSQPESTAIDQDSTPTQLIGKWEAHREEVLEIPSISAASAEAKLFIGMLGEIRQQGTNNINSVNEMHGRWEKIKAHIDSGANVPVCHPKTGQCYKIEESEGSKNGTSYQAADGGLLPNLGEKFLPVITKEGTLRGYSSQCADVTTTPQSVTHLNDTDHVVILDKQNSFMINKVTGESNRIDHDG